MPKRKDSKQQRKSRLLAEYNDTVVEATGIKNPDLAHHLVGQICNSLWVPAETNHEEQARRIGLAIATLNGIKPQDEIEGHLAAQMIATHSTAMDCLRRSIHPDQSLRGRDWDLRHAAKLMSIFAKQLETLNRNRGKGQQKVTVEHVHVQEGGQAIVGLVETGGGAAKRKRRRKSEPEVISHNPGETIDMDLSDMDLGDMDLSDVDLNAAKSTKRRKS